MSYPFVGDFLSSISGVSIYLPIPTFGLMVATSFTVGSFVTQKELNRMAKLGRINGVTPQLANDLAIIGAITGMAGARIFHILEDPSAYFNSPLSMIFSTGGFSFLGGLFFSVSGCVYYLKKKGIQILPAVDAVSPALILGYGIGRIGCQIAGDGDWGIVADMSLKPDWLPSWLWAQQYINNIVGSTIAAPGVYPTPIYESAMAFFIFLILMATRGIAKRPGITFSFYLLLAGIERFFIEKIRVNSVYEIFGHQVTQAEIISSLLILVGSTATVYLFLKSDSSGSSKPAQVKTR